MVPHNRANPIPVAALYTSSRWGTGQLHTQHLMSLFVCVHTGVKTTISNHVPTCPAPEPVYSADRTHERHGCVSSCIPASDTDVRSFRCTPPFVMPSATMSLVSAQNSVRKIFCVNLSLKLRRCSFSEHSNGVQASAAATASHTALASITASIAGVNTPCSSACAISVALSVQP